MAIAALPLIKGATDQGSKVLTGDLAVIKWTKPEVKRGKKIVKPSRDVEIHVNPVGVGIGLLALGLAAGVGAIGLYAAGMGLKRQDGSTIYRKAIMYDHWDGVQWVFDRTVIYTQNGRPIREVALPFSSYKMMLTDRELLQNWTVQQTDFRILETQNKIRRLVYTMKLHTTEKKSFAFTERPRNPLVDVG